MKAANAISHMGCLVVMQVYGKNGKQVQRHVENYLKNNGVEWTCNRLKVMWNLALLSRENTVTSKQKMIQLCRDNSIRHSRAGIPKGLDGFMIKTFRDTQRPQRLKEQAAVFRLYTSFKLTELSKAQRDKAYRSITSASKARMTKDFMVNFGKTCIVDSVQQRLSKEERSLLLKKSVKPPIEYADKLRATSYYYHREKLPRQFCKQPYYDMALSMMTEPWVPSVLSKRTPCEEMRNTISEQGWNFDSQDLHQQKYVGKVQVIQEQGCKARVVAMPSAWLQLAFLPLHELLERATDMLYAKESCVKNQTKGAWAIKQLMSHGGDIHAVDLSSATDRFPIEFQIGILEKLSPEFATALKEVVSKPFACDFSPTGEVYYATGQPMGLYGSFPLFNLANAVLADYAVRYTLRHRRPDAKEPLTFSDGTYFKVIGDDIVFTDERIASAYRAALSAFGVDISEHKSFSGNVAEFAGFVALKTNRDVAIFRPYKVPCNGKTNPLQLLDALHVKLGTRSKKPYWTTMAKAYSRTISYRDLDLAPLNPGDPTITDNCYRGDASTVVNVSNVLSFTPLDLPDLGGSTKINSIPLFLERRNFDYYGHEPKQFSVDDMKKINIHRRTSKAIQSDPLMREQLASRQASNDNASTLSTPKRNRRLPNLSEECEAYLQNGSVNKTSQRITLDL